MWAGYGDQLCVAERQMENEEIRYKVAHHLLSQDRAVSTLSPCCSLSGALPAINQGMSLAVALIESSETSIKMT